MRNTRGPIVLLGTLVAGLVFGCDAAPPSQATDPANASPDAGSGSSAEARSNAALDAALDESDPFLRVQKLAEVLPTLGPEVIPHVERRLETSRAGMHGAEFELLVRFWASKDPKAATAWAFGLLTTPYKIPAIHVAVETWAKTDPVAALALIRSLRIGPTPSQAAQVALIRGWFQKDRAGLAEHIRGIDNTAERETSILLYTVALAQAEGSEGLIRWAEAIPPDDDAYKRSAFYAVTVTLAGIDRERAHAWCEEHCDGPYGQFGMRNVIAIARLKRGDSGQSVVEWLARSPDATSSEALVIAYGYWANKDREAAIRWMQQQIAEGQQPWIPKLYGQYALQLAATSPAEAIEWAGRIEAATEREDLQVRIARRWRRQDEAAAETWLVQSSLPESARQIARNLELADNIPGSAAHP